MLRHNMGVTMQEPFIRAMIDMVSTARTEWKGLGRVASVKEVLGDVHCRFQEVTKPLGLARPLPKDLSDTWIRQLERLKHRQTHEPFFHPDQISTLRRQQADYYRDQDVVEDSPFPFLYP